MKAFTSKKIKIFNICLALFAVVVFVAIFLILYFNENKFNPEGYRNDVYTTFEIVIPKKWECLYYNRGSLGGLQGEGTSFCVFQTDGEEEDFFEGFSNSKDADFEKYVKDKIEWHFDKYDSSIDLKYLCDTEQPYEWFLKEVAESSREQTIALIYQSQKLYIFTSY